MPFPESASPWEHLQKTLLNYYNRGVRKEFSDLAGQNGTLDPDINIPRGSLYWACLLDDNDTATMTVLRLLLFFFIVRGFSDLSPNVYGIPIQTFDDQVEYKPQIKLHFYQDPRAAQLDGYPPVTGEITIRWRTESTTTISRADITTLANKIKSLFANGAGFTWHKGSILYTYVDKKKPYFLQILALNEGEAKKVIEQILEIQSDEPDWNNLTVHDPKRSFPVNPGTQQLIGKTYKKPRRRPTEVVKFRYATLHVHGLPSPITLVDTTGTRRKPVVKV